MAAPVTPAAGPDPVLVFGEVRTCLIQNSGSLGAAAATALLQLTPGVPVTRVERPIPRVVSPERATGVDCRLNVARAGKARGIGTVLSHAVLTGGCVLQGSSQVTLMRAGSESRRPWRYYLSRLGRVEVWRWPPPENLVDGFLDDGQPAQGIDLGSLSMRIIEGVQQDRRLDHHTALRAGPGVVRWAAWLTEGTPVTVGIRKTEARDTHVIRLDGAPDALPTLIRLCEDFALHEWILTTVQDGVIAKAERDIARGRDPMESLVFALNQLVPLWMPPTHLSDQMRTLWDGIARRTNHNLLFDRQVARIRDLRDQIGARPPRGESRRNA